jgi:hypothetical protein
MTNRRMFSGTAVSAAAFAALCLALCLPAAAQLPPSFTQLPAGTPPAAASAPATDCAACGVIDSIRQTTSKEQWTPLGMGVGTGGVPGLGDAPSAVTSFQIGPGFTNQGMVLLGSAGGAAYRKSPNSYERPRWEVTVKLDGGGVRIVTLAYEPYVREGDHVRVSGNNVELLD